MSLPFLEKVKNCATALAGHRAAILFNFSLTERLKARMNLNLEVCCYANNQGIRVDI